MRARARTREIRNQEKKEASASYEVGAAKRGGPMPLRNKKRKAKKKLKWEGLRQKNVTGKQTATDRDSGLEGGLRPRRRGRQLRDEGLGLRGAKILMVKR